MYGRVFIHEAAKAGQNIAPVLFWGRGDPAYSLRLCLVRTDYEYWTKYGINGFSWIIKTCGLVLSFLLTIFRLLCFAATIYLKKTVANSYIFRTQYVFWWVPVEFIVIVKSIIVY
jgi:hypothetical protein